MPPDADTSWRAEVAVGAKMITPARLQAPPPWFAFAAASHNAMGGPPASAIFLSFPPVKNPRKRLSGDQKGDKAPSVPASGSEASVSIERSQRRDLPSAFVAMKATR